MAKDLTPYQQQIVRRWYANLDASRAQRLADLVSDIWLAGTEKRRAALWSRAARLLAEEPGGTAEERAAVERIVAERDAEGLAALVGARFS